jgi:hypothetical protein
MMWKKTEVANIFQKMILNNSKDVEKDAGVILGDAAKRSSGRTRFRLRRSARRSTKAGSGDDDDDVESTLCDSFWSGAEEALVRFRCWRFFKSLNMVIVCDRVRQTSVKNLFLQGAGKLL